jgi:hypothetical protein
MWIFVVQYQPSGYAYSGDSIFRVNAGNNSGELALKKLFKALGTRHMIPSKLSEQEFIDTFEEDWSARLSNGTEIRSVPPDDDTWVA